MREFVNFLVWLLAVIAVIAIGLSLAGCAHDVVVNTVCLPMKSYSPEEQRALSAELSAKNITDQSPIAGFIIDYGALRDANRACLEKRPSGWGTGALQ